MDQKIYYRYGKTVMSVTAVIARCFCLFRKQEIGESEKKTINQPSEIETTEKGKYRGSEITAIRCY